MSSNPRTETAGLDLRSRRTALGISVQELAALLEVHPATLHRYERLDRSPSSTTVRRLAEALDLGTPDVADFFDAARGTPTKPDSVPGRGLRRLRRHQGLSVREIARHTGVNPSRVYNWEHGTARIPVAILPALAALFELSPRQLRAALQYAPRPADQPARSDLRKLRIRSGLSLAVVAQRTGYSRWLISRWERGNVAPTVHALRMLASVYGVSIGRLADVTATVPPRLLDPGRWTAGQLPDVLRQLRSWSGLTQRRLAEMCECSSAAVRAWESGRVEPGSALRLRLETVYRLRPGALLNAYRQSTV